jgi:hypothetical protein
MPKEKNKYSTTRSDLDRKQESIGFAESALTSDDLGDGDFRFTSLKAHQIAPSDPTSDEGRLYIKDRNGIMYYITATRVG